MAANWQRNSQIYTKYARNLALMYQKRQDVRVFIELLLSVSAVIIFGIFAIRPTLVTVATLNVDIANKREILQKLDTKINALAEAQNTYDANLSTILLLEDAIPANPSPDTYIRQIEGLAQRHGVTIVGINTNDVPLIGIGPIEDTTAEAVDPTAAANTFPLEGRSFKFEINVSGDFEPLTAFLRDFEAMRRPMFADTLSVRVTSGELAGALALSISGRLVYLPNEQ